MLECGVVSLPIRYLGLPLGANPRRIATWNPVIERFKKEVALWKRKYIKLWREIDSGKINPRLPTSILHVFVQNAKNNGKKIWKDSETISVGGFIKEEKDAFGGLGQNDIE